MQMAEQEENNRTSVKLSEQLHTANYIDITKSKPTTLISPDLKHVFTVDVSPDAHWIAAAGESEGETSNMVIFDNSLSQVCSIRSNSQYIYSVQFSPDNNYLVAAGHEPYELQLWKVGVWNEQPKVFKGHTESIFRISFSTDSEYFCSSSHDMTCILWKTNDPEEKKILQGHTSYVYGCAISHQRKQIATVGFDQQLIIWNFNDGSIVKQFECHTDYACCVIFSQDDSRILTSGFDGKVKVWNSLTYELIKEIQLHKPSSYVWRISLSANDSLLISAGCDNFIKIVNLEDENEEISFRNVMFGAPGSDICVKRMDKFVVASQYYAVLVWK